MRPTRALLAAALAALLCSCAAALPIIAAAVPIADRALDWISQVERHVAPLLDRVDAPTAQRVREALPAARAAAVATRACGKQAERRGPAYDCADALVDLERKLSALFDAGRPFGVQPVGQPGLLGSPPGGAGVLGVPSPCEIVRGAEACGASPAPPGAAP